MEGQGNLDAEDWKLVRRKESQAEEECGQRPGLGKTMKNFRNSHQASRAVCIHLGGGSRMEEG